ncbi:DUF72 domain-containing protein [Kaarinaea lacus]
MTNAHLELFVAARGWAHPSWNGDYYPDDLPDDWQLSFYSNEFRAIVIPESEWKSLDPVEIERWIDDTHDEFLFFLEVEDPVTNWQKVSEQIEYLGDQLGGFLFRPLEVDSDLSIMADSLSAARKLAPASILLPGNMKPGQAGQDLLTKLNVECCWNVGSGAPAWLESGLDSELAVARVTGNNSFTAREWREIIETCMQYGEVIHNASSRRVLLVLDMDMPQVNDLRTATMIGDMLVFSV